VTSDGVAIEVHARAVVVSAGAIQTPALLRRSGLRNTNIGRNLRLHPAAAVSAGRDVAARVVRRSPRPAGLVPRARRSVISRLGLYFAVLPWPCEVTHATSAGPAARTAGQPSNAKRGNATSPA
ncbi:GMC family oxidoreductase N-terminal domain-containing protein, partial [Nocardia abscessus]|uniref:GMC family oxidoreductase N-terminal domain-containing protein n=1 Tax=Nocardia abscessus TaxID=120957 RepID=UPI0024577C6E